MTAKANTILFRTGKCLSAYAAFLLAISVPAWGAPKSGERKVASFNQSARQKVIDFEDDLVEGLNKKPLDSLSSLADKNRKRRKPHLYRKRVGFRTETQETLRELRYAQ